MPLNRWIKNSFLFLSFAFCAACDPDLDYLWHVSKGQARLINSKVSIKTALKKYDFSLDERKKLNLISEIKAFAREKLEMDIDEGVYSTYVHLDRPYVTYILRAAPAYELKAYLWDFPVIGRAPYKGFFDKNKALAEAKSFSSEKYDTYVGGVRAFSSLGWFEDPVFSSMLSYEESEFVVMIFHELAHTVLFFKNQIDFNERFAEFVGRKSAELFYLEKAGPGSAIAKKMRLEWEDEKNFSRFMSREFESLDSWYKANKGKISKEMKKARLKKIQERFSASLQPSLKTDRYSYFSNIELNNAILLSYRSYNYNMEEFEKAFVSSKAGGNMKAFIEYCAQFEGAKDPEKAFRQSLAAL